MLHFVKIKSHSTNLENNGAERLCTCSIGQLISRFFSFAADFSLIDNDGVKKGLLLNDFSYCIVIQPLANVIEYGQMQMHALFPFSV